MHLLSLAVVIAILSFASGSPERLSQIPLTSGNTAPPAGVPSAAWQLNYSSTAPYLFSSVSSLLHQWGNTFFPNGHSIAPCEIPPYTLFYHGRLDGDLPPSPEWLAFDIEMSYGIMGSTRNSHMLTYQTTKPVKVIYFDGESAALMGLGQLDTQMLHIFGNITGPPRSGWGLYDEYARATGLCDWLETAGLRGPGWGFEGVIRMNAGFELIWCDFTSPNLRLLTHLNVTAPQLPKETQDVVKDAVAKRAEQERETSAYPLPPISTRTDHATAPTNPPMPPNWRFDPGREPFLRAQGWGWFSSATYHYGASRNGPGLGEVRAKVTGCGILSYYSPRFTNLTRSRAETERELYNLTAQGYWEGEGPSGNRTVALTEMRRRRRYHHLEDALAEEAMLMRNSTNRALKNVLDDNNCSGTDWEYMTNEITHNVGIHMNQLAHVVDSFPDQSHNSSATESWMSTLRALSHMFYVGFLEYPSEYDAADWKTDSKLYKETYSRCRYRYTRLMAPTEGVTLTPEESDLRWAIEETYGGVCSVLLTIGFQIEQDWAEQFSQLDTDGIAATSRSSSSTSLKRHYEELTSTWSDGLQQLMAWLGWEDEFTGCTEVCGWDERCFIPMWPLLAWRGGGGGPGRRPPGGRNGSFPSPYYPPYYPPYGERPPHRGPGGPGGPGGGPDQKRPKGQNPSYMGDETELWAPSCAKIDHFMR